jgi:predicted MFS family arabinose efflux permease
VPFCLVVLVMIQRLLAVNSPLMGEARQLDWKGLLLACIGTTSLLNGLVHLHDGLLQSVPMIVIGLAALGGFVVYQLRTEHGLMNMRLFSYPQFAAGALVAFIYGAGLFGSTYLLPVYMQMALHYAPSQAGLVLLPAGVVLAVTIIVAGRLADHLPPNLLVSIGLCLLALSFGLMAIGSSSTGYFTFMAWAIIGRIGLGFVLPSLSLGAMRGIETGLIAQGASIINFLRQLGGAIGVTLVGIVLEWRLAVYQSAAATQDARLKAFNETFLLVALFCALAVLAAIRMRAPDR